MNSIDELREKMYEIRALLDIYEQSLARAVSESHSYVAGNELKITKDVLLKILVEVRKKVNGIGR
ncbi:MAG: hypothetical protein V1702_06715 [Candidatus Woesearchaeota archaeon]